MHPKWQGQCRECAAWNTLVEEQVVGSARKKTRAPAVTPVVLKDIDDSDVNGFESGIDEFDRVLGTGVLPGSAVLLTGEPGIGKSTLILQAAAALSRRHHRILYVTGEESLGQLKLRAERLGLADDNIVAANLTSLEQISAVLDDGDYQVVIIDSIQTVSVAAFDSPPGTISQIRESAARLIEAARRKNCALFMVGHVTKEGLVAGPKVLEHMVDVVLSFEGDSRHFYRLLRPLKNRYGSCQELGVFEMSSSGLNPVANPSSLFLSDNDDMYRSGTVVVASCEGSRPILAEIQALVSPTTYGTPQRVAAGFDGKKLALLLAILEKRTGLPMAGQDVFVSVAGGLKLTEPAIDLAVLAAIVSSHRNLEIDPKTVVAGEVGLSGEIRAIGRAGQRIGEALKLGFEKIIIARQNVESVKHDKMQVVGVGSLEQALEILF